MGRIISDIMENKKCWKPPTRWVRYQLSLVECSSWVHIQPQISDPNLYFPFILDIHWKILDFPAILVIFIDGYCNLSSKKFQSSNTLMSCPRPPDTLPPFASAVHDEYPGAFLASATSGHGTTAKKSKVLTRLTCLNCFRCFKCLKMFEPLSSGISEFKLWSLLKDSGSEIVKGSGDLFNLCLHGGLGWWFESLGIHDFWT